MGILKHLLFWPVSGPAYLTRFSLEKVEGVVREELTDVNRVKEELLDLQLALELGEVDEEEYAAEEARLMRELREVRRWRKRFGMGTRGGVVQVGGEEGPRAPEAASEEEREEREERGTVVGPGASLEVSVDFEEGEEEEWSPEPDASADDSSSS